VVWRNGPPQPELEPELRAELLAGVADLLGGRAYLTALQRIVAPTFSEVTLSPADTAAQDVSLKFPVDTAIRGPAVEFRWSAVPGASDYDVVVEDLANNGPMVRHTVAGLSLEWPDALAPGRQHRWRVQAHVAGGLKSSQWAAFRILDPAELRQLRVSEERFRGSPLLLAALYRKYGLLEEARRVRSRLLLAAPNAPSDVPETVMPR
jgi:hypothetical protein